jgi:hypothetical protein
LPIPGSLIRFHARRTLAVFQENCCKLLNGKSAFALIWYSVSFYVDLLPS